MNTSTESNELISTLDHAIKPRSRQKGYIKPGINRRGWTVWVWNLPLAISSFVFLALAISVCTGLYHWQSSRVGSQLLQLADAAAIQEEPKEEIRWLARYLQLRPNDASAQVRFAINLDEQAQQWADIDRARRNLSRGIAALSDGVSDNEASETRNDLRKRLIARLVQLGGGWNLAAQRQILALNPPPADPWSLKMLAHAMLGQSTGQAPAVDIKNHPNRSENYWQWAATMPAGKLLELAVGANPESVPLTSALINAYLDAPEMFDPRDGSSATVNNQETQRRRSETARLIEKLFKQSDSGEALWTAYFYANRDDVKIASPPLKLLATDALNRLVKRAESLTKQSNLTTPNNRQSFVRVINNNQYSGGSPEARAPQVVESVELDSTIAGNNQRNESLADFRLVLAHAQELAKDKDDEQAIDVFKNLLGIPSMFASAGQLELTYLGLGKSQWRLERQSEARTSWTNGNDALGGHSLLLLEPLAIYATHQAPLDEAVEILDQFTSAVDSASLQLASITDGENSKERHEVLQGQLNSAAWRMGVLKAQVDYREKNLNKAVEHLERALASQLRVNTSSRIQAAELLATIYGEQKLWDLAGRVLDEAALLEPTNPSIRRQAAIAWQKASAKNRSLEQWKWADDGSFQAALSYAQALATKQSNATLSMKDSGKLRAAVSDADKRLLILRNQSIEPKEAWRLELLKIMLPESTLKSKTIASVINGDTLGPTSKHGAKQVHNPAAKVEKLSMLCEKHPQVAELQAIVALTLQQAGFFERAKAAADRLNSIENIQPMYQLEFHTKFAVNSGNKDHAIQLLDTALKNPKLDHHQVAKFAAEFLYSIGRNTKAIDALRSLDAEHHDPTSLLLLGDLLLAEKYAGQHKLSEGNLVEQTTTDKSGVAE